MEKIAALIDKLQELKNKGAALSEMAYYTQLLYAELMSTGSAAGKREQVRKKVAVIMPGHASAAISMPAARPAERTVQPVVGQAIEQPPAQEAAEPAREEMKERTGNLRPAAVHNGTLFDREASTAKRHAAADAAAARELNEVMAEHKLSLNDKLKHDDMELGARLTETARVGDLSRAIGVNDKFLFINELFRGDRNMFDRSVKTINECDSLEEAEYWIDRELKIKQGWQDKNDTVQQFYRLVRKRFSRI